MIYDFCQTKREKRKSQKDSSASLVTPSPKEECMGRTNGTVMQRARFEIGNVKHLQQLAVVNLGR
jgi:hypothetical protein